MLRLFFIVASLLLFAWIKETKGCVGGVLRLEEGRLEVCVEDQWISVCGNGWTDSAGNVACRQLGYESASSSHQTAPTASINGILFHRLNCSGLEATLLQCSDRLSLTSDCNMTLLQCNQIVSAEECNTGDVRLLNEEGVPNAGTVSLCVDNHWTNLTDDTWSNSDAMVVCKMLNFQSGSVGSDYEPGSGGSSDDSVKCDGSELSIYQCIVSLDAAVNNNFAQEASVLCQIGGGFENGAVRLYRNGVHSSQYYFGIVQLQYNGATGNICDDLNFGHNEADVICHQLGYAGASSHSRAGLMSYGIDNSPTLLDDVHCSSSDYLTILQCSYSTSIDSGCSSNSNDVTVSCYTTRIWESSPFLGMIRLQDGSYSNEGRIEVYCNGQWGSICSAGFSSSTANTVCRQLGYSGHNGYNHLKIGSSPHTVWFNGSTSEGISNCLTSIASCPSQPVTNCSEGATVECIIREFDKVTNQINSCNDTTSVTITPSQTSSSTLVTTGRTSTTTSTTNTIPTVGATDLPFYRESLFLYTGAGVTVFILFLLCVICCCCCCHCYCRRKKSIPYNARHSQHITQRTSTITSGTSDDLCIVRNPMAEDMVDNTDPSIAPSSPSVAPPPAPPLAPVPPPPPPPPPPAVGSHTMPNRRSASLPNHESMLNKTPIVSPPPSAPPPPPLPSTPPSAPPPPSATRTFPRKVSAPPSLSPIPAFRHPVTSTGPPPPNTSTDQYFNSLPTRKSNPTTPQHVTSGPAPPPAPPPPPIPATNSMDRRLSQPARSIGSVQQQQQQFQAPAGLRHYSSTQPNPVPSGQAMRGPPPNNYPAAASLSQYSERRVSFNN